MIRMHYDPTTPPFDPLTLADLEALAELIIADAVAHCLGDHLDLDERDPIEVEVDAMFDEGHPGDDLGGT